MLDFLPACPRHLRHAKYAVVFHITPPSENLRGLALAYMLLRFCEENIRAGDYHIFKLLTFSYRFFHFGIHGVMFFDDVFQPAYLRARSLAFLRANDFTPYTSSGIPVLSWFSTEPSPVISRNPTDRFVRSLIRAARYVDPILKFLSTVTNYFSILQEAGCYVALSPSIVAWLQGAIFLPSTPDSINGTLLYIILYSMRV